MASRLIPGSDAWGGGWGTTWSSAWSGTWGLEEEKPEEAPRRRGGWRLHGSIGQPPVPIETQDDFLAQIAAFRAAPGSPLPDVSHTVTLRPRRMRRNRALLLMDSSRRSLF